MPDQGWEDLVTLSEVAPDTFGNVLDDFERNEKVWKIVRTLSHIVHKYAGK